MSEEKKPLKENLENLKNVVRANITGSVLIEKDDKYLLIQEKLETCYGKWNLPGGLVDEGYTLEETAIKEAREETGYDVELVRKIGTFYEEGDRAAKNAFHAKIIGGELMVPNEEIMDAKWFSFEEIVKMKNKLRSLWVIDVIENYAKDKKIEEYSNNWKRSQADFENYKKDQAKIMGEFRKFASLDMVLQILPVLDNFNSSLEHVPENEKDNAWVTGIIYIKKQLEDALKNNGAEEIEVKIGDKFNPEIHEAITDAKQPASPAGGRIESESTNKISKVVQKGYMIGGKVIRAVKVVVG